MHPFLIARAAMLTDPSHFTELLRSGNAYDAMDELVRNLHGEPLEVLWAAALDFEPNLLDGFGETCPPEVLASWLAEDPKSRFDYVRRALQRTAVTPNLAIMVAASDPQVQVELLAAMRAHDKYVSLSPALRALAETNPDPSVFTGAQLHMLGVLDASEQPGLCGVSVLWDAVSHLAHAGRGLRRSHVLAEVMVPLKCGPDDPALRRFVIAMHESTPANGSLDDLLAAAATRAAAWGDPSCRRSLTGQGDHRIKPVDFTAVMADDETVLPQFWTELAACPRHWRLWFLDRLAEDRSAGQYILRRALDVLDEQDRHTFCLAHADHDRVIAAVRPGSRIAADVELLKKTPMRSALWGRFSASAMSEAYLWAVGQLGTAEELVVLADKFQGTLIELVGVIAAMRR